MQGSGRLPEASRDRACFGKLREDLGERCLQLGELGRALDGPALRVDRVAPRRRDRQPHLGMGKTRQRNVVRKLKSKLS